MSSQALVSGMASSFRTASVSSASSASRIASDVAGARSAGAFSASGATDAIAARIASSTENDSSNGGSPTAFERKIVGSALSFLSIERDVECRRRVVDGRNLVGAKAQIGARSRHADRRDEFARFERGFLIAEIEGVERHRANLVAFLQHDVGIQRDGRGHRVADERAVCDIAAERARVADRTRGEARPQFGEFGIIGAQRCIRVLERYGRSDGQRLRIAARCVSIPRRCR